MASYNYDVAGSQFNNLLDSVISLFSENELMEVRELLDNVEYGLALQTFVDIVLEEKKQLSHRSINICEELAQEMHITEEVNIQALRKHLKSER